MKSILLALLLVTTTITANDAFGQNQSADPANPADKNKVEAFAGELEKKGQLQIRDFSKSTIERPLERLVESATPEIDNLVPKANLPNSVDYLALIAALKTTRQFPKGYQPGNSSAEIATAESDNPTVKPGLVDWHPDFETACAASQNSGKPVLLFQLLGNLDERFT